MLYVSHDEGLLQATATQVLHLESVQNICVGGFAAYCDENAKVSGITVENCEIESNFITTGNLGSILAGLVGVLRDGSISASKVKNVTFNIENNVPANKDYCFTNTAVSQVYGNSTISGIETIACKYYESKTLVEFTETIPVVAKNNYVNEDGESSIRLYYALSGKNSDVYVTVYGDLIPIMTDGTNSFRLREATVWETLSDTEKAKLVKGQSLVNLETVYYYRHYNIEKKEYHWNVIQDVDSLNDDDKKYDENKTYALAKKVYLAEVPVGADVKADTFYTYDVYEGKLEPASGKFQADTDYYVLMDVALKEYELDVTVYTESDKTIVVRKGATEDDDVLAEATYTIPLAKFKNNTVLEDELGNEFVLCPAELYLDCFFKQGEGFLADGKGFVITDATGAKNRDFSSYVLVTGRPVIAADAITYKSAEE